MHTKQRRETIRPQLAKQHEKVLLVLVKTEVLAKGPNVRFVVTTRDDTPEDLYDFYIQRVRDSMRSIGGVQRRSGCRVSRLCRRGVGGVRKPSLPQRQVRVGLQHPGGCDRSHLAP